MSIGIQMFSRKRLANVSSSLSRYQLSDSLLRRGRLGAEKISRELLTWFLLYTVFLCDWSLPWFFFSFRYFSRTLSYACRPSSIRYPFTQSLTHSRAHLPVAASKMYIANQSSIVTFLVTYMQYRLQIPVYLQKSKFSMKTPSAWADSSKIIFMFPSG